MPDRLPILVLAGSDRQPAPVPRQLKADDMLTGLKGALRLPSGRCLAGELVERYRDRIDHLVAHLERSRAKIIIPTPALSEILVRAGAAAPDYLAQINSQSVFRIVAFDERAAVERGTAQAGFH